MTTFEDVIVSGKVGIGTTSPSTKLHVVGFGTPQMPFRQAPVALIENAGSAKIEFRDTKRGQGWRVGTGDGGYCISESSEALLQTDYLVIQKGTGNVGIGTTSPSNKLHVVGSGPVTIENVGEADILFKDTTHDQAWEVGTNENGWYVFDTPKNTYDLVVQKGTGNVGIGTTRPSNRLHVVGPGPVTIENAGEADILFKDTTHDQAWEVGTNENGWYVFDTPKNTYDLVVQKDTGNVGIGTTNPVGKLDVRGGTNAGIHATSDTSIGVHATSTQYWAVRAEAYKGTAVFATSDTGFGIDARSNTNVAIIASSQQGIAIEARAPKGTAVFGTSTKFYGVHGASDQNIGVLGISDQNCGVSGKGQTGIKAVGMTGWGVDASGFAGGVHAIATNPSSGIGVYGKGKYAGYFEGVVVVTDDVQLQNADCAEDFDIPATEGIEPGSVMVIGAEGGLCQSTEAYDKKVAGVISGAGDYKPGMVLDRQASQTNRMPVSLMGKVYCKVDAQYAPIEVGDLLTTSSTPGHAMKATDPLKAFGAVLGKALRPLPAGTGLIPILIALQ